MHREPGQRLLTHALGLCLWRLGSVALAAGTHTGFYGVVLNGVPQAGFALLVVDEQQRPLMAESDFLALGFAKRVPAVMQEGQALVPLFQLEGLVVTVDHPHQRVALEVTPEWYVHQRLNLQDTPAGQALPAPLGGAAELRPASQSKWRCAAELGQHPGAVLVWFRRLGSAGDSRANR